MPMKLVHYVKSAQRKHRKVVAEVKQAYERLGQNSVAWLYEQIPGWQSDPKFKYKVTMTRNRWQLAVYYNTRTRAGKRFNWADKGTGLRGPYQQSYPVRPKKQKSLKFTVPYNAKTPPSGPTNQLPAGVYYSGGIEAHPGIWPRRITAKLYALMKARRTPGSFNSTTEAAVRRGLRKK